MIYGDDHDGEYAEIDILAIRQSNNLYVYAMSSPIRYLDYSGSVSKEAAAEVIKANSAYIISAGKEFGVNPAILASVIYAEQVLNVTYTEKIEDAAQAILGLDCSVGIAQVRISTAEKVENNGYISKTTNTIASKYMYTIPIIGKQVYSTDVISRKDNIYNKLKDNETCVRYAAAYIAMIQDIWKDAYSEIDGRTAIIATLYNVGENGKKGPNANPKSNEFGDFAKENYYYMKELLS